MTPKSEAVRDTGRVLAEMPRRFSLRIRVVVAIMLAALAPQLIVFVWSQLDRNVPGRMWRDTWAAGQEARRAVATGSDSAGLAALAHGHRVRLRVLDANGELVFDRDGDDPADRFGRVEELLIGASMLTLREIDETFGPLTDRGSLRVTREHGSYIACDVLPVLYCEAAVRVDGEAQSATSKIVHVQQSSRRAVQAVYALRAQLVRLAFITVPIALLIAIYTGRRIVRPVEHLRRQALARAATASPTAALDPERRDELGALAEAFNALLDALERKRLENEAFVADLVHELKNPVAAVRATAEALGSTTLDRERAERLARVLSDSSAKLDRLVSQFLELARADAGMPNEERAVVDLAPLLTALTTVMRDDPRFSEVTFSLEAVASAPVYCVPHRLDALFRELYENGASFAGSGGRVDVRVILERELAIVSFHDSGPGIAKDDVPRVFDRFFTTRGARRGTGLGLALVRAVARAHGGDVEAATGDGATLTVKLPLSERAAV